MGYQLAVNLILVIHLLFIAFVLLGGLLCLRLNRWAWLHLPALAWGVLVEWAAWPCPLTPLENYFRQLSALQEYRESFIEYYLVRLIYPEQLNDLTQWVLGACALGINLLIYSLVLRKHRKSGTQVDE